MNYNKIQLNEFSLHKMVQDCAIVLIGKRGTGKSFITQNIAYHLRHKPGGVCIAPTDKLNPFYKKFFPDLYIHYDTNETIFKKIMKRQLLMLEKAKQKRRQGKKVDPSGILIMDDCLAQKGRWAKDENIREILMNGRHYKLTYILTMQYIMGIGPELRSQFDYIFLLKEDSTLVKRKLWDNYASIFKSLAMFERVLTFCTRDHCCMVIDNRKPGDTIQDKVFWFKAQEHKFRFGSETFWHLHKKYYDPDYLLKGTLRLDSGALFGHDKKNELNMKIEKI